jgi:preprotein translocase subunit SecD
MTILFVAAVAASVAVPGAHSAPPQKPLNLDLQGGSYILLEVDRDRDGKPVSCAELNQRFRQQFKAIYEKMSPDAKTLWKQFPTLSCQQRPDVKNQIRTLPSSRR